LSRSTLRRTFATLAYSTTLIAGRDGRVKGRDLYLAKYLTNPANPTILYPTQQHGNEQLTTEGALAFIKSLGTGKMGGVLSGVNILVVPMRNRMAPWVTSTSRSRTTLRPVTAN
jgi:hypothetical protein